MSLTTTNFETNTNKTSSPASPATALTGIYRRFGKRALDLVLVIISLPVVLPMVLLMALLVMSDGHAPFYSQKRVGRNGKSFRMWKLRTMVPNADAILMAYLEENPSAKAEWIKHQKLNNDPRITRVGSILRRTSMDELPQLLNVLTGGMSLVGPRPMMECQRDSYDGGAYFRLLPGITGNWQVSDRNNTAFAARVGYDDVYENALSFGTDLKLLALTVVAVVRRTGR